MEPGFFLREVVIVDTWRAGAGQGVIIRNIPIVVLGCILLNVAITDLLTLGIPALLHTKIALFSLMMAAFTRWPYLALGLLAFGGMHYVVFSDLEVLFYFFPLIILCVAWALTVLFRNCRHEHWG